MRKLTRYWRSWELAAMSAPKTEPAVNTARSSVPSRPKQQSAAAPAQKDDGFQIDLDAFDDIKKDAAPRAGISG